MFNGRRILSRNGLSDLLTDRMDYQPLYEIVHLKGEDIEIAFTHTDQNGEEYYSFVNGQHTTLGGTHQAAFKKYIAEVIKYEGDNSTFIWKHPCEDFNLGSQLIVHESQEAVFMNILMKILYELESGIVLGRLRHGFLRCFCNIS